jgi:hypothetical protein
VHKKTNTFTSDKTSAYTHEQTSDKTSAYKSKKTSDKTSTCTSEKTSDKCTSEQDIAIWTRTNGLMNAR